MEGVFVLLVLGIVILVVGKVVEVALLLLLLVVHAPPSRTVARATSR